MSDFDFEPVRGLPAHLPKGETLLWQGAPRWRGIALRAFHVRGIAIYFAVMLAWQIATKMSDGESALAIVASAAELAGLGLVAIALLCGFSWLIQKTTVYSITSARVILRFGVALPMTITIPFRRIEGAALKLHGDGTGDIPLALKGSDRIAYLVIWPHARPWRMGRAEPMFRAIQDAEKVGQILARAAALASRAPATPERVFEPMPQASVAA